MGGVAVSSGETYVWGVGWVRDQVGCIIICCTGKKQKTKKNGGPRGWGGPGGSVPPDQRRGMVVSIGGPVRGVWWHMPSGYRKRLVTK